MSNLRIGSIVVVFVSMVIYFCESKVYEKCELARELRDKHFLPFDRIGTFVCIAERQSNLNTQALSNGLYFGMYQISGEYWCDLNYAGNACGVQCSRLLDDDLTDDLSCVQIIFDEHQRIFNNGFHAWPSSQYCQSQGNSFIQECFIDDNQIVKSYETVTRRQYKAIPGSVGEGKVYERCELARELLNQHQVPMDQIATWVCIAKHESAFNTSAIGRLNWDGSEDHGLFQISDIYWCGESGKACGVQCSEMRDNDITDDIRCIRQIHTEHQRLSGDGFNAWAVYPRCKGQSASFIDGCFDDSANEIMPYRPVPGIQQPKKVYAQPTPQRKFIQSNVGKGKVYDRCELAQELRYKYKIPMEQVATWVCIAKHESAFNTSAIGRLNADGSEDHGLFQISDIYWCSPPGQGTACGVECSKFEDSDISDDVECMLKIHDEHTLISGDGFNAWTVYRPHCQGRSASFIDGCFNENDLLPKPAVTQPYTTTTYRTTSRTTTTQRTTLPTTTLRTTVPTTTTTRRTTAQTTTTKLPTTTTQRTTTRTPTTTTQRTTTSSPTTTTTRTIQTTPRIYFTTVKTAPAVTTTRQPPTPSTSKLTTKYYQPTFKAITTTKPSTTYSTTRKTIPTTTKTFVTTTTRKVNPTTTSLKPATFKNYQSGSTAKPVNAFDQYFNSIPKGSSKSANPKNDINYSQKSVVIKLPSAATTTTRATTRTTTTRTTTKKPLTTITPRRVFDQVNSGNAVIRQEITTRRTTLGNPYSKPSTISLAKTSVITGKTALAKNDKSEEKTTIKTTPRTTQKVVRQSSVLQSKSLDQSRSGARAATLKPFNLFDFYLSGDYSSRPSFVYQPIQFSQRSTVIIGKASDDYSGNRIGRLAQNVTPYSIEHLLSLTTPRT